VNPNLLILSYPTYGPSGDYNPAATYQFLTRGYRPPRQARSVGSDIVHNKNGVFKYVYDNGPSTHQWEPFEVSLEEVYKGGPSATTQWNNLLDLWDHTGVLRMSTADGTYNVHWSNQPLEKRFISFPSQVGDKIEYSVVVQFEEA
jgi:hypothetical protein